MQQRLKLPVKVKYPPKDKIVMFRPQSLRQATADLLRNGASVEDIEKLVIRRKVRHDCDSYKTKSRFRALALMRMAHHDGGYGLIQDANKNIYAFTHSEWLGLQKAGVIDV